MSDEGISAREPHKVPPYPEPPPEDLSAFQLVTAMRTDGLSGWPRRAYEEMVVQRRFFHRNSFILNEPDAIRHVLVDHDENYSRTAATIRVLRPLLGEGLFLSESSSLAPSTSHHGAGVHTEGDRPPGPSHRHWRRARPLPV